MENEDNILSEPETDLKLEDENSESELDFSDDNSELSFYGVPLAPFTGALRLRDYFNYNSFCDPQYIKLLKAFLLIIKNIVRQGWRPQMLLLETENEDYSEDNTRGIGFFQKEQGVNVEHSRASHDRRSGQLNADSPMLEILLMIEQFLSQAYSSDTKNGSYSIEKFSQVLQKEREICFKAVLSYNVLYAGNGDTKTSHLSDEANFKSFQALSWMIRVLNANKQESGLSEVDVDRHCEDTSSLSIAWNKTKLAQVIYEKARLELNYKSNRFAFILKEIERINGIKLKLEQYEGLDYFVDLSKAYPDSIEVERQLFSVSDFEGISLEYKALQDMINVIYSTFMILLFRVISELNVNDEMRQNLFRGINKMLLHLSSAIGMIWDDDIDCFSAIDVVLTRYNMHLLLGARRSGVEELTFINDFGKYKTIKKKIVIDGDISVQNKILKYKMGSVEIELPLYCARDVANERRAARTHNRRLDTKIIEGEINLDALNISDDIYKQLMTRLRESAYDRVCSQHKYSIIIKLISNIRDFVDWLESVCREYFRILEKPVYNMVLSNLNKDSLYNACHLLDNFKMQIFELVRSIGNIFESLKELPFYSKGIVLIDCGDQENDCPSKGTRTASKDAICVLYDSLRCSESFANSRTFFAYQAGYLSSYIKYLNEVMWRRDDDEPDLIKEKNDAEAKLVVVNEKLLTRQFNTEFKI